MSAATSFQYSGTELEAVAAATNYYQWILHHFAPFLGRRVVEVGAGIGTFSDFLVNTAGVETLVAIEPAENVFPALADRFQDNPRVRAIHATIDEVDIVDTADSLVAVNVLEHVENDESFLRSAATIVVPGGHLLLFVPAHQFLYGSLDAAFDHYRRYSKTQLSALLVVAGWKPLRIINVNIAGILPWLIAGKLFRLTTIGQGQMRVFDRVVVPFMRKIESIREPFIGQSLLVVASNSRRVPMAGEAATAGERGATRAR